MQKILSKKFGLKQDYKLPERAPVVSNSQTSNFKKLHAESSDISSHHRNIQTIITEAYKEQKTLLLQ